MKTETFFFSGYNVAQLPAMLWLPEGQPKAILQITHGMTEHIGRYEGFAGEMTAAGIAVAGFDLRGHGKNPGDSGIAVFGEGDWEASLMDMKAFSDLLGNRFSGIPHFLHGVSLGSFLAREYLGRFPQGMNGAVILGTGVQPGWLLSIIMTIVKGQIRKVGYEGASPLVHQLSFGSYNQKFKPNRTELDWLCADEVRLDGYLNDPLCRKEISAGLFYQMLQAMARTGRQDTWEHWNKTMPVLMLSGENDPVGDMGKGVRMLEKQMLAAGFTNLTVRLIPGARHLLLQEERCGAADQTVALIQGFILG